MARLRSCGHYGRIRSLGRLAHHSSGVVRTDVLAPSDKHTCGSVSEEHMKWMLIVAVFGGTPMETGLVYNSLDECLKAEENIRAEWDRAAKETPNNVGVGDNSAVEA